MSGDLPALAAGDFGRFFHEVYGDEPFTWQAELAARVLGGAGWPEVVDVPTGMGKTAVLDVAVFALAVQADLPPEERTAPTRTFMVVDRRVIVDQAYERACWLRKALVGATSGVRALVAERLAALSVGALWRTPLVVVRMRGGATWAATWLTSPAQPAVICGTVDQFGSRLLFRGYGVGEQRRPLDAALTGTDRLLVLDEAHLSQALIQTTSSVDDEEARAVEPVLSRRRPRPVLLSATPPVGTDPEKLFVLDPTRELSVAARDRLGAHRFVRLVDLKGKTEVELVSALSEAARRALERGAARVLVVANTVSLARAVFDRLDPERSEGPFPYERALLSGRCRAMERELLAREWLLPGGRLSAATPRHAGEAPVLAVATQTIEVGADLDVDALVTECCPLDALLQRLGRLDRRGAIGASEAVVVHQASRHDDDVLRAYGAATGRTWDWLVEQAGKPAPTAASRSALGEALEIAPAMDLGPAGLTARLTSRERALRAAEAPLVPVALGPQLAAWARTSPTPQPDQDVSPFLRGVERSGASVQLCWRALEATELGAFEDELRATPVEAHELVSVPFREALAFLSGQEIAAGGDLEGSDEEDDGFEERATVVAFELTSDGGLLRLEGAGSLRPGATVIVRWDQGGHDRWGWTGRPSGDGASHVEQVPDVADLGRHVVQLRLRPEIMRSLLPAATLSSPPAPDDEEPEVLEYLQAALAASEEDETAYGLRLAEQLRALSESWGGRQARLTVIGREGHGWLLLRGSRQPVAEAVGDGDSTDLATSTAARKVGLEEHLRDVERRASAVATSLGLPEPLCAAVALAGRLHDVGKADQRFQAMLHGGSGFRAEASGRLLAKSGMDPTDRRAFALAQRASGWPPGLRHEAISAAVVEAMINERGGLPAGLDPELVGHLVASHHGHSRPLLPPVADPAPTTVHAAVPGIGDPLAVRSDELLVDWRAPGRFDRLGATYGWWGLALLETILRLADQSCSAEYGLVFEGGDGAGSEEDAAGKDTALRQQGPTAPQAEVVR